MVSDIIASSVFVIGAILFFVAVVALGPIVTIWALNKVFGTGIELTWATWFAVAWLHAVITGAGSKIKWKKDAKS